jgi:CRP/FNR family cyclic AMP-dependent transcriptional regulator
MPGREKLTHLMSKHFLIPLARRGLFRHLKPRKPLLPGGRLHKCHVHSKRPRKIVLVSRTGKEAIVANLKPGDFVGEGGLARQSIRIASATATTPAMLLVIGLKEMIRVLHEEHAFSDRFISYMVERNIRIEEDLIDQLFNSSEKRLARTLLLLARYGNEDRPQFVLPKISQEELAEMVGTTRSRVNFFMNKFKSLGFIHNDGGLHVNDSLLSVVLHD